MRALFVAFMLCVASASVVEPASVLGDDPMQFDQLLDSAFLRHDVAFLQAATADDMRFTHAVARGGAVWNKQQFVDAARVDDGLARTVDSIQVERRRYRRDAGHLQVRTPRPDRAEYHVYFVRLYRRGPAGWQFVSHRTVREVDGPLSTAPARAPDMPLNPAVGTEEGPVHPGNGVSYPRVVHEVGPPYLRTRCARKFTARWCSNASSTRTAVSAT